LILPSAELDGAEVETVNGTDLITARAAGVANAVGRYALSVKLFDAAAGSDQEYDQDAASGPPARDR
jgi:hypothetical protein